MKVRVTANKPPDSECSDISSMVGKEYEVLEMIGDIALIKGNFCLFDGEYEIVDES